MSSRSLNKVMLIGNLTRDPILKYTPKNTAVCNFSIATNRSWTTADGGEKREETDFHNIVVWSRLAEVCGQHLHKGDKVYLEGRLQTRKWQDKEGQDRYTTEVVVDSMIMLSPKSGYSSGGGMSADAGDMSAHNSMPTEDVQAGGGMAQAEGAMTDDKNFSMNAPDAMDNGGAPAKSSKKKGKKDEAVSDEVSDVQDISDDIPF